MRVVCVVRNVIGTSVVLASLSIGAGSACSTGDPAPDGTVRSMFVVPASVDALDQTTFFDQPWPNDRRRDPDGAVRFVGFPNPSNVALLDQYVADAKGLLKGFSPVAAAYLRFTGPIDPASLPQLPPATLAVDAAVQVIDVDPTSPERGQRHLAQIYMRREEGRYWPSNTLAVMPMLGRPLRPKTTYAVVVTRRVRSASGGPVTPSPEVEAIVGLREPDATTRPFRDTFSAAVTELGKAGVPATEIVHLTVFTTNDPTEETFAIADDVPKATPAPTARDWKAAEQAADYDTYEAIYGPSPNYQAGAIPFQRHGDGGSFAFEGGKPKVQSTFDLRFALAVPNGQKCPAPAGGYPIVLYAHGTGGNYRSFLDDGTGGALARRCLASMGVDQIFHGTRPGAPADGDQRTIEVLFFNFDNVLAARTNNRQSAIDVVQQARLFTETRVKVPSQTSRTGKEIAFDGGKVTFFGHSQGGLNGPLYLAADASARGAVLSGAGSVLALNLLEKTKPVDIPAAIRFLLGLSNEELAKELNVFHPAMTLVQSLVDAADTTHYGRFITLAPRAGRPAKSILQTEGVQPDGTGDTYAPPHGIEALSVAIGLPRIAPGIRPVAEAGWAGIADVTIPATGLVGNLAGGAATGALAQFAPRDGNDGHFVVFDLSSAQGQAAAFLEDLSADPRGKLTAAPP